MFTLSLHALQAQLNGLLEGVGGGDAAKLLDLIGHLGKSEQKKVLTHFQKVVSHILQGETRLLDHKDEEEEKLVNALSDEIVRELKKPAHRKFSVVDGGKLQ